MPPGLKHKNNLKSYILSQKFPSYRGGFAERLEDIYFREDDDIPDAELDELIGEFHDLLNPTSYHQDAVLMRHMPLDEIEGDLSESEQDRLQMRRFIASIHSDLDDLSIINFETLELVYHEERKREISRTNRRHSIEDRERFFNATEAFADFSFWQKLSHWSVEEAVSLIFGKDPRVVNLKAFETAEITPKTSPFASRYFELLEMLRRAVEAGEVSTPLKPAMVVRWVSAVHAQASSLFDIWAAEYPVGSDPDKPQSAPGGSPVKDSKVDGRLERSYQKLILGLAILKYNFDVDYDPAIGSTVFSQISNDLRSINVFIDADTVGTHILNARKRAHAESGVWVRGKFKNQWR